MLEKCEFNYLTIIYQTLYCNFCKYFVWLPTEWLHNLQNPSWRINPKLQNSKIIIHYWRKMSITQLLYCLGSKHKMDLDNDMFIFTIHVKCTQILYNIVYVHLHEHIQYCIQLFSILCKVYMNNECKSIISSIFIQT